MPECEITELGNVKTGDAFEYDGETYIAICLTTDPYDAYCLNVTTKEIITLEEDTEIKQFPPWGDVAFTQNARRGEPLKPIGE